MKLNISWFWSDDFFYSFDICGSMINSSQYERERLRICANFHWKHSVTLLSGQFKILPLNVWHIQTDTVPVTLLAAKHDIDESHRRLMHNILSANAIALFPAS